jgi:hypothetical protein
MESYGRIDLGVLMCQLDRRPRACKVDPDGQKSDHAGRAGPSEHLPQFGVRVAVEVDVRVDELES